MANHPVKLVDISDALATTDEESRTFYNARTDTLTVAIDGLTTAAEWEAFDGDDYLALPGTEEIDDYGIMVTFIEQLPAGPAQDQLTRSIQGRGAFRYFRDTVARLNLEADWYAAQDQAYRELAQAWCTAHQVPYQ